MGRAAKNPHVVFSKLYLSCVRDYVCYTLLGSATYVHTPNQMGRACSSAPGWGSSLPRSWCLDWGRGSQALVQYPSPTAVGGGDSQCLPTEALLQVPACPVSSPWFGEPGSEAAVTAVQAGWERQCEVARPLWLGCETLGPARPPP